MMEGTRISFEALVLKQDSAPTDLATVGSWLTAMRGKLTANRREELSD
jgi:hypothetical protein